MLLEIHMLKNYPSTNLNRDDTGTPKSCLFGGIQRSRISSQCLKRSWRTSPLMQHELKNHLGIRTRKLPELICQKLKGVIEDSYLPLIQKKLSGIGNKNSKETNSGITNQIILYSPADIERVAQAVQEEIQECGSPKKFEKMKAKEIEDLLEKNALDRPISLDIALFGRMVTSNAFADVEAAMQVAHAFSVNKVAMETDFFTAMDDCLGDSELGSGMMGDVDYNSSCYYLYASLDVDKLRENLKYAEKNDELIQAAIPVLLQAMVYTNPGGKQNSFAGHILPSAICIECKDYPVPVSYANAFVKPVYPTHDEDLISRSIAALANHIRKISEVYNVPVEKRFWFTLGQIMDLDIPNTENCKNFVELLNGVQDLLKP